MTFFKDIFYSLLMIVITIGYFYTDYKIQTNELLAYIISSTFILICIFVTALKYKKEVMGISNDVEVNFQNPMMSDNDG